MYRTRDEGRISTSCRKEVIVGINLKLPNWRTHNFMLCRIQTYQVIEEIQNWMVKNIKVSFFVKCIEAHLQSKYSANFINEL
jgi:hypothetical protein